MFTRPLPIALATAAFLFLALSSSASANYCEGAPGEERSFMCGGPPAPSPSPSPSPPPPPPPPSPAPPPPNQPYGWLDLVDGGGTAWGWACDADDFSAPLTIHFYADGPAGSGTWAGATVADKQREPAVGDACGGNRVHGFGFRIPDSLRNGSTRTLYAHALNIGGGEHQLLWGSPKSFRLVLPPEDPYPEGWFLEDDSSETMEHSPASTCKSILYRRTARSILRAVLFRMNMQVRWCWVGARVVEASAVCWNSDIAFAIQASPCPQPQGQYFPTAYDKQGGWFAVTEGTFRNCLPDPLGKLTCWRQVTITLQVRVQAGGTWSGAGGNR